MKRLKTELQGSGIAISKKKRRGSSKSLISKLSSAYDNVEVEGVHVEVIKTFKPTEFEVSWRLFLKHA